MKLQTLKPRIQVANTSSLRVLKVNVAATPRQRGRAWMVRRARLLEANPLCCKCEAKGVVALAMEVDHIIPLHVGGPDTDDNTQNLCIACHAEKTRQDGSRRFISRAGDQNQQRIESLMRPSTLAPSGIPLTIVCGPAAGGKSTYIKNNAKPGDIIIDMDMIRTELGIGAHEWNSKTLERSLERRNEMLASLASATASHAWFIVSAASSAERDWWRQVLQPVSVVVVMAAESACVDRIVRTREGERAARSVKATRKWWREYTKSSMDEVICTG